MPRPDPAKRTPLWLQRLRAKDLLQVVRQFPDFPIVVETFRECLDDDLDLPRLRAFLDAIAAGAIRVVARRGEIASPFASDLIFRFTSQYLYQWDEPRRGDRPADGPAVDEDLLDPLLDPASYAHWLDPGASAGSRAGSAASAARPARPTRWPRRSGAWATSPPASCPGRCSASSPSWKRRAGPADRAAGTAEPARWIGAEEAGSTRRPSRLRDRTGREPDPFAVRRRRGDDRPPLPPAHALVGLDDLTARYPIDPRGARTSSNAWSKTGGSSGSTRPATRTRPAGPTRGTWRRSAGSRSPCGAARASPSPPRSSPTSWPAASTSTRPRAWRGARRSAWSSTAPRVRGPGRPLGDGALAQAGPRLSAGLARRGPLDRRLALAGRGRGRPGASLASPSSRATSPGAGPLARRSRSPRRTRPGSSITWHVAGASFATDLARQLGLEPSRTRRALLDALRRGLVTNDRFDPLRPGAQAMAEALAEASAARPSRRPTLGRPARALPPASNRPEGRWSLLAAGRDGRRDRPPGLGRGAARALRRPDPRDGRARPVGPPWRDLVPWLARAELRGELRRGYFVEGLSGVQYATAEAAEELARLAAGCRDRSREPS